MTLVAQEIPKIGLVMESVKVVRWLKNVGDTVTAGEVLLEVESEKSALEIEAVASGRLAKILVQADDEVRVGGQVAWIDSIVANAPDLPVREARKVEAIPVSATPPPVMLAVSRDARVIATPVARKLAAQHKLDVRAIHGSGPGGRVQLRDVEAAVGAVRQAVRDSEPSNARPLTPLRRAVARAMTLSVNTVPQFTVTRAVDWTVLEEEIALMAARPGAAASVLTANDFLLQSVARGLVEYPGMNATFLGDPHLPNARIVPQLGTHIGLVVGLDDGFVIPVLHDVHLVGLGEIARRRVGCVERCIKEGLKTDEADAASLSIANLGADGPDRFTAIISPPQSAILAVGRRRDCVVARGGAATVRPVSDLTLSVDHRVADARLASQFLSGVVAILEGREWRV